MKLCEILSLLELKMPSRLSDADWVMFLNAALRRYGRHIGKSNVYTFPANGLKVYPLPHDIKGEGIKGVAVDRTELAPVRYGENMPPLTYCLDPSGFIMLGTAYAAGTEITVLYNGVTPFLTQAEIAASGARDPKEAFDNQDCGCDGEYSDALIYGAMAYAAEAAEDIAAAENYKSRADETVREAKQSRYGKRGKYPVIRGKKLWKRSLFPRYWR